MLPSGRRFIGMAVAAAVAVPLLAAPPAAASPSGLAWESCDNGAQCAKLRLPVDWSRPGGPTFELSVARRAATGDRVGTLVFGPGGPGDSGVDRILETDGRWSKELHERFDIVSFDPRGVRRSEPVTCSTAMLGRRPSPLLKSQADFDATVAYNRRLDQDCGARSNGMVGNAHTLAMVKDLEALRAALGEEKISYHGSSYGTLLGEQYAEAYPHRIRAMVLESVVDHSKPGARAFLTGQAATAQDSFEQFVKWCEQTSSCGADVRSVWRGLIARAERGQLADPSDPRKALAPENLVEVAFRRFYAPDWAELASTIAKLDASKPPSPDAPAPPAPKPPPPTREDPFAAVFCADWSVPVRDYPEYARHLRRIKRIAPDMPYTRPLRGVAACLGSTRPVANPQHRLRVGEVPPILLTNALHDPASSYRWATEVERQLGRKGVLLTYAGSGHGTYRRPCVQRHIDRYLTTVKTPPRGSVCQAVSGTG
ncbi:alpha/beta hydrolase [Spirillospora sp. CA-294931]|uniref:alpha/beta hydrolase n=1 Tax=Spirillospora sp. CA-294931 TaxID=3240042 RepID=UPI003D926655